MKKKRKQPAPKLFKLSGKAQTILNTYLAEIRRGIMNVCELHTHDSAPSMSKANFEETYIEKILGQTVTVVSASIRAMTDGLTAQKENEYQALIAGETNDVEPSKN